MVLKVSTTKQRNEADAPPQCDTAVVSTAGLLNGQDEEEEKGNGTRAESKVPKVSLSTVHSESALAVSVSAWVTLE